MNYRDVKTFKELAEAIEEYLNRHKLPCTDSITGEASMQLFTSLKADDAQLAFIRLKNKYKVELPVPDSLIELLDSCGSAERKLQEEKQFVNPAETERSATRWRRIQTWFKGLIKAIFQIFTKSFWDAFFEK